MSSRANARIEVFGCRSLGSESRGARWLPYRSNHAGAPQGAGAGGGAGGGRLVERRTRRTTDAAARPAPLWRARRRSRRLGTAPALASNGSGAQIRMGSDLPTQPSPTLHEFTERGELALESAREDREAAPGLRVQVLVVEVEGGRVALPLPLVAGEEREEALDPRRELRCRRRREEGAHLAVHVHRQELVADGGPLDRVEDVVRHEVLLVRLSALPGAH